MMFKRGRFFGSFLFTIVVGTLCVSIYSVLGGPRFVMDDKLKKELENTIYMELKQGDSKKSKKIVSIRMLPDVAPMHVARIKELVRQGFYDKLKFHRVIHGFMVQTGDPRGDGTGGSGKQLPAEFSDYRHTRGVVSMARAADINSADSQFFIVTKDSDFLDRQYTVWGKVIEGMEYVDQIKQGDPNNNGMVQDPDIIVSMKMAIDVEKKKLEEKHRVASSA
jgi:peptidylprolyl isomerase